ncbi:EAL and HDOD domain-containing protein [Konateibacter massiliensis]|uniref:EAL and HDOD domain-containing protein n=1 Tax=Konateibacter massiliensis TaxID=2002841 RepID=UPI000C15536D|nr:EAL domain-containing protein [Konateibacter massiliensis]
MFIARQPILNKAMKIYGYELLFRADAEDGKFGNASAMSATASVVSNLFEQGMEHVVGRAKAFINFSYDFIMSDSIELINPETLIIEVLETVKVDSALIDRIEYLKSQGYQIALDDFEESYHTYPLVPLANIIKYDIRITPLETLTGAVKQGLLDKKILLAEKIETESEFRQAAEMGFHLFQGYFFSKPKIVGGLGVRRSSNGQYTLLLDELKKEEPSYDIMAKIIETDVNLAYRFMKVISHKKGESTFHSLRYALVRMGLTDLERWINILMLQEIAQDKPLELMKLSLSRSRFGEFMAKRSKFKNRKNEISMMCMFSVLDALLNLPMEKALEGMLISEDVFKALVFGEGSLQSFFRLILSYERGEWDKVCQYADIIELDTNSLYEGYLESIRWASRVLALLE